MSFVTFRFSEKAKALYIPAVIEYVNKDGFIEKRRVNALIDTGATQSGIDIDLAELLDFTTTGVSKLNTAGGIVSSGIHTVNIQISNDLRFDDAEIMEIKSGVDFVIGMDVLKLCDFIMSHKNGNILFSMRCPTSDKGERFVKENVSDTVGELLN